MNERGKRRENERERKNNKRLKSPVRVCAGDVDNIWDGHSRGFFSSGQREVVTNRDKE